MQNDVDVGDARISIDLLEAARNELHFLEEVDQHPCLYSGPLLQDAIRRYFFATKSCNPVLLCSADPGEGRGGWFGR